MARKQRNKTKLAVGLPILASKVAKRLSDRGFKISERDAKRVVEIFFDIVAECLDADDEINVKNFAKFYPTTIKQRRFVNPKTGDASIRPAFKTMRVKPSANLVAFLNPEKNNGKKN